MTKLSAIPAPAVAGCVRERTAKAAVAEIKNCYYDGADMIDLHLSCLEDSSVETLKKIIEDILPAHLGIEYWFWYLTWEELERIFASWQDIEDRGLTWSELEICMN